jgi:hydroxysqualene synthase
MVGLQDAYAECLRIARGHYENFPVASLLIPRAMRPHVAAVYAFARTADDFADEGERAAEERERLLDGWRARLHDAAAAPGRVGPLTAGEPDATTAIFLALGATMRDCRLPPALLADLLSAFRQDVRVTRYDTWDDLFDYCRRSANPVGRLVLRIAGHHDPRFDAWSDAICTALQLTNFWQDVGIDARRGRIYLPAAERRLHGADDAAAMSGDPTEGWRRALAAAGARTRALFEKGRPLGDGLRGRLRYEIRATWLGGMRILAKLEAAGFDAFTRRPSLGPADMPWLARELATWSVRSRPGRSNPSPAGAGREADGGIP